MQNSMTANSDGASFQSLAEVNEEEEPAQMETEVKLEPEEQWSLDACLKMDNVPSTSNSRLEQTSVISIAGPRKQDIKVIVDAYTHLESPTFPPFFSMSK